MVRIALAADHNGVAMKRALSGWLQQAEHEVDDRGVHDPEMVVDYPLICLEVCRRVLDGHADRAIVIGGTGGGEVIACNKLAGIRAALGYAVETARISRTNNDSNVLVLGAKVTSAEAAAAIVDTWLRTEFSGGRHALRLEMIAAIERGEPPS